MKMSYLSQNRKRKRNPLRKIITVFVVCVIVGFLFRGVIVSTMVGTGSAISSIVSFLIPGGLRSNSEIIKENETLREKVMLLTALNADRNALESENVNLKFELGRKPKAGDGVGEILGIVKSRPSNSPFDTFVVDVGSRDGVTADAYVYYGSLVIGKVIDVNTSTSKVQLFSSPGNIFQGVLVSENINIDARGLGGGSFEALVPSGVAVEVGDTLVLPSITTKVFGVVAAIENKEEEGFKRILFSLPVNLNQINQVLIW